MILTVAVDPLVVLPLRLRFAAGDRLPDSATELDPVCWPCAVLYEERTFRISASVLKVVPPPPGSVPGALRFNVILGTVSECVGATVLSTLKVDLALANAAFAFSAAAVARFISATTPSTSWCLR